MRIESHNGFVMNQQFSRKRINSVPIPDVFTKKASKMSDDKFKEAIIQQAHKDAPTGKFGVECPGFRNLMDSYVSVVSPDRKGIIDNALATLGSINQSPIPQPKSISLLDILFGKRIVSTEQ